MTHVHKNVQRGITNSLPLLLASVASSLLASEDISPEKILAKTNLTQVAEETGAGILELGSSEESRKTFNKLHRDQGVSDNYEKELDKIEGYLVKYKTNIISCMGFCFTDISRA